MKLRPLLFPTVFIAMLTLSVYTYARADENSAPTQDDGYAAGPDRQPARGAGGGHGEHGGHHGGHHGHEHGHEPSEIKSGDEHHDEDSSRDDNKTRTEHEEHEGDE